MPPLADAGGAFMIGIGAALLALRPDVTTSSAARAPRPTAAPISFAVPAWRLRHIDLNVTIDPVTHTISGVSRLTVTSGVANAPPLLVDVGDSLSIDSAFAVASNGRRTPGAREANVVRFALMSTASQRARYVATLWYHARPPRRVVGFAEHNGVPRAASYGVPQAAREWWPTLDSPAQKADSANLTFTAPAAVFVASNGRQVTRTLSADGGWATTHWHVRYPLHADAVSFSAGDFTVARQRITLVSGQALPVEFHVFPEDSAKAAVTFVNVSRIMRFLEDRLGSYPFPREQYALAEFARPSFREGHTITNIGASLITGQTDNDQVIAHEMAHQWFGNAITAADWTDIWLHESFAEFMAWEWMRRSQGDTAYTAIIAQARATSVKAPIVPADPANFASLFGAATFARGPLVLIMLRDTIGAPAFDTALRSYVVKFQYGTVTTADFVAACERAAHRSLTAFFDRWVYGLGDAHEGPRESTYAHHTTPEEEMP